MNMSIKDENPKKPEIEINKRTFWEILTEENSDEDEGIIRQPDF